MGNNGRRPGATGANAAHGSSYPLGATVESGGVNFCVYSQHATGMTLLLFGAPDAAQPERAIELDPTVNRTANYWHVFVPRVGPGQVYAYRAQGPYDPDEGLYFASGRVLLDPYARAICGQRRYDRDRARAGSIDDGGIDNCATALRAVVVDPHGYDWENDTPPPTPPAQSVIYEMHVGAFTAHPESGVAPEKRGTYAGLIEKIPYLQELGVTAVELLPVHEYDRQDAPAGRRNYWGYSTIAFFAPHAAYSSDGSPLGPVNEFRDLVKALHKAGLEVYLDVVYNHTAEGGAEGPILSWRGLDNPAYYLLDTQRDGFADYTGCGNTVNANHPVARRMILDSLRYWVQEMHVDGFRFDLASVLSRDETGEPVPRSPILQDIDADPVLAGTRLIAEAWDAGGLYQVGSFGGRFAEWNGPYRDDVRRFVKGDQDAIEALMARIVGSADLFNERRSRPSKSINFVTCHDGFTLNDLVSYNRKHNEANGEANRDGTDDNLSWNCGEEGPSTSPAVEQLRERQLRNFLTILLLSHGTPMLLMGDEVRRTQQGNNNTYCQENELNWFDWRSIDEQQGLLRFVRRLIRLRRRLPLLQLDRFWTVTNPQRGGEISWHGRELGCPDWRPRSRCLAYSLGQPGDDEQIHVMLNASDEDQTFAIPTIAANLEWKRVLDTAAPAPGDTSELASAPTCTRRSVTVRPFSVQVLQVRNRRA